MSLAAMLVVAGLGVLFATALGAVATTLGLVLGFALLLVGVALARGIGRRL